MINRENNMARTNEQSEREATEPFGVGQVPASNVSLCAGCRRTESSDDLCLECHIRIFS